MPKVPYPKDTPDQVQSNRVTNTQQMLERGKQAAEDVRASMQSAPPPSLPLLEATAANSEISLLVLQKVGYLEHQMRDLVKWRDRQEDIDQKATDVLLHERLSRVKLDEEITRVDLDLRKARSARWGQVVTRALLIITVPSGTWSIWKWASDFLRPSDPPAIVAPASVTPISPPAPAPVPVPAPVATKP
jgi:hypothetical protein